uniref:HECT-type E3 ubiquitin transferase n=1 Tax=Globisporangium ultimum (strain ATCC 200006 / CBS 805.95 / DAOM BR144) TaxID=431595 RepID=K3X480_GLOUD
MDSVLLLLLLLSVLIVTAYLLDACMSQLDCRESAADLSAPLLPNEARKEFSRKLDIEGNLYWYRDDNDGPCQRLVGFTMNFIQDVDFAVTLERQPSIELQSDEALEDQNDSTVRTRPPKVTIEVFPPERRARQEGQVMQATQVLYNEAPNEEITVVPPALIRKVSLRKRLQREVLLQTLVLIESSVANPAQMPLELAIQLDVQWQHVLEMAARDFPTKFSHFVTTSAGLVVHVSKQYIKLNVVRENLLADSMESLATIPREHIRSVMRVEFVDEPGVDAGALQREWYLLLNDALTNPRNGVFVCVNEAEQVFYLNANSAQDIGKDHLLYFYATGRLIGRTLLEGQVLGFHLALPLLKIILGLPILFADLEYFDPEVYRSLVWITNNKGVSELSLDFSIAEKRGNKIVVIDLIENGREINVTDENVDLYLERRFRYSLFENVSSQLYALLKGIYEIIPQDLLALFDPEELDYVLCGSDEIDVDDWEHHSKHTMTRQTYNTVGKWFWELVHEMPNEYRRRLLRFATGSSRVPLGGFRALTSIDGRLCPFLIHGVKLEQNEYIVSHACFNRLDIPLYDTRDKLETVLYAILDADLNGFTRD